ncbi:hypothetical protein COO91_05275 [Nostoc flagelliforme CCNUN1]|uniref:Uncharacterized protein n=1 Tax=Nostoc flagelliforme CCNUN1 TaxID=2038116 RepID=A0A2K8SVC4_9NOSO|nr:hypothetical protein COO91_05275 [Nostoc flagelliforme CCNUN1]
MSELFTLYSEPVIRLNLVKTFSWQAQLDSAYFVSPRKAYF